MDDQQFRETVWGYYAKHARVMPWREEPSFYNVLVSEIMLQQTQVSRVETKFHEFMSRFPSIETLADASLADVLQVWQGLGYNRRAKFLHQAGMIVARHGAPMSVAELVRLPGVGRNTAGAIMNYVHQQPTPYIETNIRTVYFYHYFPEPDQVISDRELLPIVDRTLDHEHPREWFWALMDYGTWLKASGRGRLTTSAHYKKQTPLAGSHREMRGMLVRELTTRDTTYDALAQRYATDPRFESALDSLERDGLITVQNGRVHLTK